MEKPSHFTIDDKSDQQPTKLLNSNPLATKAEENDETFSDEEEEEKQKP